MRAAIASAVVALLLCSGDVRAEEAESATADESDEARAREHFVQGVRLSRESHWSAALALFEESLRLHPTQAALYNRGLCLRFTDRFPEAIEAFEQLLERYSDRISASRRAEVEQELEELRGLVGRITVELDRPGAMVRIDGEDIGRTPLDRPTVVTAGRHEVEVIADGFQPLRRTVTVAGGAVVTIEPTLDVTEAPGRLRIDVAVPAAEVTVDGERVGASPLPQALSLDAGPHEVSASRPGYRATTVEVTLSSNEEASVALDLRPLEPLPINLAGHLDVNVSEDGARLIVDGEPFIGTAPLPIGQHRLDIELEGFAPWSRLVDVSRGEPTYIEATLHPDASRRERYRRRARGIRIASYVILGLSIATIGTAVGILVWNDDQYDSEWAPESEELGQLYGAGAWDSDPSDEALYARVVANNELLSEIEMYDYVGAGLLAGGIVLGLVSMIMGLAGPNPERYEGVTSSLRFTPSAGGFAIAWNGSAP